MDVFTGKTLGRYHIIEQIGRGGMATVYKARQTDPEREVAVKILPAHLTDDQTFVTRFLREAQFAAHLKHQNIIEVYEVNRSQPYYLAMQLVEGETLAAVIQREHVLKPERIANLLRQIASALDYAHAAGVIHRDVKPSNILLDRADHVVLTDFGIARAVEGTKITQTGTAIGTPDYMSPEQGLGQPTDARSDVYSLGVVLYEMLTGQVPFHAETPLGTLHKQVYDAPPMMRQFNASVPRGLEYVVLKALAKQPDLRYQSAGELACEFDMVLRGQAPTIITPVASSKRRPLAEWGIGAGVALLGLFVLLPILFSTVMPAKIAFNAATATPAVNHPPLTPGQPFGPSPGSSVEPLTSTRIWTITPVPVSSETRTSTPAFTMTTTASATKSQTATRSPTRTSTPTDAPPPPSLRADLVFTADMGNYTGALYSLPRADPAATPLFLARVQGLGRAALSPDGKWIAFESGLEIKQIHLMDATGRNYQQLTTAPQCPQCIQPSFSPNGQWIIFSFEQDNGNQIYTMDLDGSHLRQINQMAGSNFSPVYSSDGQRIAFVSDRDGDPEIYVMNTDGTGQKRLTRSPGEDEKPCFMQDGRIAFHSQRSGHLEIYLMNVDGTNPQRLTSNPYSKDNRAPTCSDGTRIAYQRVGPDNIPRIYILDTATKQEWGVPRISGSQGETGPAWVR